MEKQQVSLDSGLLLYHIEISRLDRLTTSVIIITHTKTIFARNGIPEMVYSDNGPQSQAAAYKQFASTYQFKHVTSKPYFPQSNGEVERAVATIKSLLRKDPTLHSWFIETYP